MTPTPAQPAAPRPAARPAGAASPSAGGAATATAAAAGNAAAPLLASASHRAFEASLEFFLAPIAAYLRDPEVTEVMVNGPVDVFVERGGKLNRVPVRFASEADVRAAANNVAQFVGQPLTSERPIMDGRLPDGSRVCVVLGDLAARGTQINIRRFPLSTGSPDFLLARNAITPLAMEFVLLAVKARCNVLVAGGAGCGKTTLINVLTTAFAPDERIIIIEDTRELQVRRDHVVQLEARPADAYGRGQVTIRDLFAASLRMRPDRIIVGEVRRAEALDLIQAMTSGHRGALATVHASSPYDACHRIETLAMMADVGIPLHALRRQVASAVDVIIHAERLPTGRRVISRITEVGLDEAAGTYALRDMFVPEGDTHGNPLAWTGARSSALARLADEGLADEMQLTRQMVGNTSGGAA